MWKKTFGKSLFTCSGCKEYNLCVYYRHESPRFLPLGCDRFTQPTGICVAGLKMMTWVGSWNGDNSDVFATGAGVRRKYDHAIKRKVLHVYLLFQIKKIFEFCSTPKICKIHLASKMWNNLWSKEKSSCLCVKFWYLNSKRCLNLYGIYQDCWPIADIFLVKTHCCLNKCLLAKPSLPVKCLETQMWKSMANRT